MKRAINLWFAVLGLRTNKLRSGLTTLGVIIGIGAVIMIVSLGNGLRRSTQLQLEAWSSGTMEIRTQWWGPYFEISAVAPEEAKLAGGGKMVPPIGPSQQPRGLESADVLAVRRLATTIVDVVPLLETWATIIYKGQYVPSGGVVGVTPEYTSVYRHSLKYGRFLNYEDEATAAPVIVIEEAVATEVFGPNVNPVGEILHFVVGETSQNYTVVGVLATRPGMQGFSARSVVMPLRSAQLRMDTESKNRISLIAARVDAREPAERRRAVAEINTILRTRRGIASGAPEDFAVQDTLQFSEESLRVIRTITLVLSAIAGISLVVGSIGLMNIMLVGVAERTWEIGLRRALGAEKADILFQFLSEGVVLALLGGVGGLALGLVGSYVGSNLIEQLKGLATITPDVFAIAAGVSLAVGIVASVYPAWHAASLQPTAALRRG